MLELRWNGAVVRFELLRKGFESADCNGMHLTQVGWNEGLTMRLSGRAMRPDQRRERNIAKRPRGALALPHHGPLQPMVRPRRDHERGMVLSTRHAHRAKLAATAVRMM